MTMDRIFPVGGLGPKAGTDTSTAAERPRHPWHDEAINIATRAATTPQAQAREITVQEAAEVLLAHGSNGERKHVYDACEGRCKVYKFDAVLRALAAMQKVGLGDAHS